MLARDLDGLLEKRDEPSRHRGIGGVLAVIDHLDFHLEGQLDLRHLAQRGREFRPRQIEREREHARCEGMNAHFDERLGITRQVADEFDVGVIGLGIAHREMRRAAGEHRIERGGDFLRAVVNAEQLCRAKIPSQIVRAAKIRRDDKRLDFVLFELALRASGTDARHARRRRQHALVRPGENGRRLHEPDFMPALAALLESADADERLGLERVGRDGQWNCRRRRETQQPATRRARGDLLQLMNALRIEGIERAFHFRRRGARLQLVGRITHEAQHEHAVRGWCEHVADARAQRAHVEVRFAQRIGLAVIEQPQRADALVTEHEHRERHGAAVTCDQFTHRQVGIEGEIAHAAGLVSIGATRLLAADRRRVALDAEEPRIERRRLEWKRRIERRRLILFRALRLAFEPVLFWIESHVTCSSRGR